MYLSIYEKNYVLLSSLIDLNLLKKKGSLEYNAKEFMDLHFDYLARNKSDNSEYIISMCHHYNSKGETISDPDMQLRIIVAKNISMAEALTYQDCFGFKSVYLDENMKLPDPKTKKELNNFLSQWLNNIKNQKFVLKL